MEQSSVLGTGFGGQHAAGSHAVTEFLFLVCNTNIVSAIGSTVMVERI